MLAESRLGLEHEGRKTRKRLAEGTTASSMQVFAQPAQSVPALEFG
jgi:hypothetical protein